MPMLLSVFLSSLQCALKMYQKWCSWLVVIFPMVQLHLYPDQNRCALLFKILCIALQKSGASLFQKFHHTPFQNLVIFPLNNLVYPFKNLIIFLFQKKSSTIRTPPQFLKNLLKILSYLLPPCNCRDPSICGLSRSFTCVLAAYHPCMVIFSFPFFLQARDLLSLMAKSLMQKLKIKLK